MIHLLGSKASLWSSAAARTPLVSPSSIIDCVSPLGSLSKTITHYSTYPSTSTSMSSHLSLSLSFLLFPLAPPRHLSLISTYQHIRLTSHKGSSLSLISPPSLVFPPSSHSLFIPLLPRSRSVAARSLSPSLLPCSHASRGRARTQD